MGFSPVMPGQNSTYTRVRNTETTSGYRFVFSTICSTARVSNATLKSLAGLAIAIRAADGDNGPISGKEKSLSA
jgi:hypothetical protein